MMSLALIHHYSYDYGNGGTCYIRDTITAELAGSMILDDETNEPRKFSSVGEVYRFLLKRADIEIDEVHVVR